MQTIYIMKTVTENPFGLVNADEDAVFSIKRFHDPPQLEPLTHGGSKKESAKEAKKSDKKPSSWPRGADIAVRPDTADLRRYNNHQGGGPGREVPPCLGLITRQVSCSLPSLLPPTNLYIKKLSLNDVPDHQVSDHSKDASRY
ncbi:hypothetical protein CEXT_582541 [Caerostris extrusa]|uniref:Uncharacterized protein n=1 Tax=Caerostris extrusa TaxID=172846 RepID=A0AAV4VJR0_CAEEX|nr:hypothetical protein CEXT_582541 [Caerostris extrusa]